LAHPAAKLFDQPVVAVPLAWNFDRKLLSYFLNCFVEQFAGQFQVCVIGYRIKAV
jgi:hypothetical protein